MTPRCIQSWFTRRVLEDSRFQTPAKPPATIAFDELSGDLLTLDRRYRDLLEHVFEHGVL